MKVLLIGFGSIGKRHYKVLSSCVKIENIHIVTKQTLKDKITYKTLNRVYNIDDFDYFVIASETFKHYEQLIFLENKVKNKLIFCEKPLFETYKKLNIRNNKVYIGYVLRFHPLMQKLYNFVQNDIILNINVSCGQYLPTWRDGDYKKSYSAKKDKGGGVLLDLSHEIDYTHWLCGRIEEVKSYQSKVSELDIDSDDLTTLIGKTKNNTIVTLSIDYISKITHRKIFINTVDCTYELDFIQNTLIKTDKQNKQVIYKIRNLDRNDMFIAMHKDILGDKKIACSFNEAQNVMAIISKIQEQNNV